MKKKKSKERIQRAKQILIFAGISITLLVLFAVVFKVLESTAKENPLKENPNQQKQVEDMSHQKDEWLELRTHEKANKGKIVNWEVTVIVDDSLPDENPDHRYICGLGDTGFDDDVFLITSAVLHEHDIVFVKGRFIAVNKQGNVVISAIPANIKFVGVSN